MADILHADFKTKTRQYTKVEPPINQQQVEAASLWGGAPAEWCEEASKAYDAEFGGPNARFGFIAPDTDPA
jgi:hypothetical protein